MAALNTDLFKKLSRRWVGTIGSGGVADAAVTTIPLSSATNLPTDTAVIAVIDRVDTSGTTTATLEESVIGVVSGSNLVTCTRGVEGTAQAHSAGAVVEILVTAKGLNDLIDGLLVQHNQLGLHTNITACDITASGTVSTNVVAEKTSASGVTIDGVKLKDSIPYCDTITEKTTTAGVTVDNCLIKDGKAADADKVDGYHVYSISGTLTLTPNANNTITHNLNTTSQTIFCFNGDYSTNAFVVKGVTYVDVNSFTFYADGGGAGGARINYVIFY